MRIRFITPFSTERNAMGLPNIGKAYNEAIAELPDDCWIVLRDGDTMFLTHDWGSQIEAIIKANPYYDLITCMTNRLGISDQLLYGEINDYEIGDQIDVAKACWTNHGTEVVPAKLAAGLCMIFHKSIWVKAKGFPEHSITFDRVFSERVINNGGKIGIAKGLYIFHLYRFGQAKPQFAIKHLIG